MIAFLYLVAACVALFLITTILPLAILAAIVMAFHAITDLRRRTEKDRAA